MLSAKSSPQWLVTIISLSIGTGSDHNLTDLGLTALKG
jgi:hypothetical protein